MTSIRTNGEVEFRFFRASAQAVVVAGDFTAWEDKPITMRHEGNGWWSVRVSLQPGEYRFRYVADGQWFTDFASHGVELKKQTWNSVLLVQEASGMQFHETEAETRALAA